MDVWDTEEYVMAIPIRPYDKWPLPMVRAGIDSLNPQPNKIGIVTTNEIFDGFFSDDDKFVLVAEHSNYQHLSRSHHCARNRTLLANWFGNKRDEEWLWWIDSDVRVFENTFIDIFNETKRKKCLVYKQGIPSRTKPCERNWHGHGCVLIHRIVANAVPYICGELWMGDGVRNKKISEDNCFFGVVKQSEFIIRQGLPDLDFKRTVVQGNVTEVLHCIEYDGEGRIFSSEGYEWEEDIKCLY